MYDNNEEETPARISVYISELFQSKAAYVRNKAKVGSRVKYCKNY